MRLGRLSALSQEQIVLGMAVVLFAVFALSIDGFLTAGNILSVIQNVSVLGILGAGMAMSIIGRGIDLSVVSVMAYSVAWTLSAFNQDVNLYLALLMGFGFALAVGLINGILIAYIEIPAIFATLASGTAVAGFGQYFLVDTDVVFVSDAVGRLMSIGSGRTLGVPNSVISLAIVAGVLYWILHRTVFGRYLFAMGDNTRAARVAGIPVRPMMVAQYLLTATIAFIAGLVTAMAVESMNTRVVNSTLVYDVILIAVIGGISLSGGRGSVRNVLIGTVMIGVLLNGMTMMNMPYTAQNIVKGAILLVAIIADSFFNPRDEQTSQQGDI
ncbi:ABC transporter permease [Seohaeicola zhoushanensis]|uniref:ABC transporter permease n=1 Tax=Seohaeicola zhoushanensis TaxID=1569283 RepID=A0A8J3MBQ2_9RHOB|nr:ABC transporter permease [Seohaeicola zhoushanensis]GHF67317.1 ABC transporter permease [Seohaeicola zhoushanensis]